MAIGPGKYDDLRTYVRETAKVRARLNRVCTRTAFWFLLVRVVAPAPDANDPPDMHAFYHTWMQPPWWLIAALVIAGFAIEWGPELYHAALDALERK